MIVDDSFSLLTTRMIVHDSFSVRCFGNHWPDSGQKTCFRPLSSRKLHTFTSLSSHFDTERARNSPTSFPGPFPWLGGGAGKALASGGHVPTLHPEILGVIN